MDDILYDFDDAPALPVKPILLVLSEEEATERAERMVKAEEIEW